MRIFLEEVVLDFPSSVDPQAVCKFDLVERMLKEAKLVTLMPGTGQLMLVENAKSHRSTPISLWAD